MEKRANCHFNPLGANIAPLLYQVQPGDTLNQIIEKIYQPFSIKDRHLLTEQVKADNPRLPQQPNLIIPRETLLLRPMCSPKLSVNDRLEIKSVIENFQKLPQIKQEVVKRFAACTSSDPSAAVGIGLGVIGGGVKSLQLTTQSLNKELQKLVELIQKRVDNKISMDDFKFKRDQIMKTLRANGLNLDKLKLLTNSKNLRGAVAYLRGASNIPIFAKNVNELTNKVSGFKKAGGVLTVASAGVTITNIAHYVDQCNYREAWGEAGSFAGGLGGTFLAGLVLASSPVGIFTAFVIGGAVAIGGSWGISSLTTEIYDQMGNRGKIIDVIDLKRLGP